MPRTPFAYVLERFPAFTQTFIVREILEMRRQGMRPLIISLRREKEGPDGHFPADIREDVIYLPEPDDLTSEIKGRRAAGKLPRAINQRLQDWGSQPDKMRLYEAIYAGALLKKHGVRHIHSHFAGVAARTACLIGQLYGIGFGWTGHAQDIFCQTDFPVTLADLVSQARLVVSVSDFSTANLRQAFPDHARKIHRIYNGIELPPTPPARSPVAPPLILSVGRCIEKKGFAPLIEACAVLKKNGVPFTCQIIGDGPLHAALREKIQYLDLADQVVLPGSKSQEEIGALLRQASVFALPCVNLADGDSDNLPTVITEAMTFAVPVVSTRVAGIPEQVLDRITGLLVPENDPGALAGALQKILNDPATSARMGRAGFERARAEFGQENTVRQLRQLLATYGRVSTPWRLWWK